MPEGWATAMMELVLRVNKDQAQRDIDNLDGSKGGRTAGQQFGQAFTREQLGRMTAGMNQFATDSARAGGQAGQVTGRQFGQAFYRDAQGRWRDALGAFASDSTATATKAGQGSGTNYGTGFRGTWERQKQAILARFTADAGRSGDQAGQSAGRSFAASFTAMTSRLLSGGGGGAGGPLARAGAQGGSRNIAGSLAAGAGPNILGLQVLGRAGLYGGLGVLGLGALPALAGAAAPAGLAALGGGAAGAIFGQVASPATDLLAARTKAQQAAARAQTPAQQQAAQQQMAAVNQQVAALDPAQRSMFTTIGKLQDMWDKFTKSFAPLFAQALAPIPGLFASILPALRQFFTGAVTLLQPLATGLGDLARSVLPLLGQAFRATGPLIQPLLSGLGQLLAGILPGLITLLHAAAPAVTVLANFLAGLGRGLGGMLAQFAPVMQASSVLLGDLLGLVNALLPIIGQLAGIFARALAPAFTAFAAVIQQLLPGLTVIGRIIGQLAAAMLTDLVAAFQAVAGLFAAIAPALTGFARAISGIFTVLENTGVWAILGDAIESIVAPLGRLISAVLRGLTPILPPLIRFIGQLAATLAGQLGQAVAAILPPLTRFATQALALIARFLPPILPLITQLARQLGGALTAAVVTLAPALTQLATAGLQALAIILPAVLPLLLQLSRIFTAAVVAAITAAATALAYVVNAIPQPVLTALVVGLLGLAGALKALAVIKGVSSALTDLRSGLSNASAAASASTGVWGTLGGRIGGVRSALADFRAGLGNAAAAASESTGAWGTLGGRISAIGSAVASAATAVASFVTRLAAAAASAVASAARQAAAWIVASARIVAAFIAQAAAATAAWIAENAATLGIIAGITLLVAAVVYLATHWHQVWTDVRNWARDAWQFLTHGWGQFLVPGLTAIRVAVEFVRDHWRQAWTDMRNWAADFWRWLHQTFAVDLGGFFTRTLPGWLDSANRAVSQFWGNVGREFISGWNAVWQRTVVPMHNLFTRDLPSWFSTAVSAVSRWWNGLYNAIRNPVARVIDTVLNGLINTFDWITSHIGLGRPIAAVHPFGLAHGGRIPGYGGGDRWPALLESGEAVVDKQTTAAHAAELRAWGVPGMQAGGRVGQNAPSGTASQPPAVTGRFGPIPGADPGALGQIGHAVTAIAHKALDIGKITAALATGNTTALNNAFADLLGHNAGATALLGQILTQIPRVLVRDLVNWIMGNAGGASGNAIADYAASFIGRIPYVWGGTAVPGGADCSGFVEAVYRHFGINAPRTSEAQGAWVHRSGPQPGGLAFYHCLPGDQPVLTSAGPVPIGRVEAGMMVATWDAGLPAWRRCAGRSAPRRQMTYRVSTATTALEASGNHPFLTVRVHGWDWTPVDDLRPGDLVCRYDEAAGDFREEAVTAIEPLTETDTYDIGVDGTHCFIAAGIVVHNSPPGGPDPGHVAIIKNAATVISQGGGMGPQLMPIRLMPLLWTGIPPGGFGGGRSLGPGGGNYTADIQTVLRSMGLPLSLTGNWLRQIQTESGGNLNAVNRTDINAQLGHPSVGLLQIVPSTFAQYAGPYRNTPPLVNFGGGPVSENAMAQIYTAIHYANDVYHGAAMADVIGRGHGYARGGWVNEPVTGVGRYSRALYSFAEAGREYVTPEAQMPPGGGTGAIVGELRALRGALDQVPARTAAGVARAITVPAGQQATAARIGAR